MTVEAQPSHVTFPVSTPGISAKPTIVLLDAVHRRNNVTVPEFGLLTHGAVPDASVQTAASIDVRAYPVYHPAPRRRPVDEDVGSVVQSRQVYAG